MTKYFRNPKNAGQDVTTPTNRPARSKSLTIPDVERIRPNTRPNTSGTQETQEGAGCPIKKECPENIIENVWVCMKLPRNCPKIAVFMTIVGIQIF